MATVSHDTTRVSGTPAIQHVQWVLTTADSDGEYVSIPEYADKTVHVYGTFGSGTLALQGTNEDGTPANPISLTDPQGNAIELTAAGIKAVTENPLKARPLLTGSTGASVTVLLVCRKPS